jgi:nitronate monooxygenase
VNLTFLPTLIPKDYGSLIDVIVDEGINIVETAGRNPEPFMERIKAGGAKVIHKCTSVRFARKAESIGCDYVSIDGCECAGHPGEEDITSLVLIPVTADAVNIPLIASGGFADARGLVAALALGAGAMNMGTRFVATQEAPAHENVKQWLVDASEGDTMYVMRSLRNTERVLRNEIAEKVVEMEGQGAGIADLAPLVTGQNGLRVLKDGETDVGLMAAGQSVGLVHDVPTVRELIDTIIDEAHQIVGSRLSGMIA